MDKPDFHEDQILHTKEEFVHDLGPYGHLHEMSIPASHFKGLRSHCLKTACSFKTEAFPGAHFTTPIINLLQQTGVSPHGNNTSIIHKTMNGFVVYEPRKKIVQAVIYDHHLCHPDSLHENNINNPSTDGNVKIFALVNPPNTSTQKFIFTENNDGVLHHHEISEYSPVQRMVSKMLSARALSCDTPKIIYSSPNFGSLKGYNLSGLKAAEVKNSFINLINVTKGGNKMYDSVLKLPPSISELLSLNDPKGKICIAPLQNGIMGYRKRKHDDGQSLILLCSSNDFFHNEPLPTSKSLIQVYKMSYASKAKDANRIFVSTNPNAQVLPKCPFNTPLITPNMNVQDALNIIEYATRKAMMQHLNCSEYPNYVNHMKALNQIKNLNL